MAVPEQRDLTELHPVLFVVFHAENKAPMGLKRMDWSQVRGGGRGRMCLHVVTNLGDCGCGQRSYLPNGCHVQCVILQQDQDHSDFSRKQHREQHQTAAAAAIA
jgi:hypothetical protein